MKRRLALVAVAVAAIASILTGCGGSDSKDDSGSGGSYCDDIKDVKDSIDTDALSTLDQKTFDTLHSAAEKIQADAPSDVADDWQTFVDKLDELDGILKDAGLSFDDFDSLQAGQLPDGVSQADLTKLASKLQDFTSDDLTTATDNITKNVKDECGIDLDDES